MKRKRRTAKQLMASRRKHTPRGRCAQCGEAHESCDSTPFSTLLEKRKATPRTQGGPTAST